MQGVLTLASQGMPAAGGEAGAPGSGRRGRVALERGVADAAPPGRRVQRPAPAAVGVAARALQAAHVWAVHYYMSRYSWHVLVHAGSVQTCVFEVCLRPLLRTPPCLRHRTLVYCRGSFWLHHGRGKRPGKSRKTRKLDTTEPCQANPTSWERRGSGMYELALLCANERGAT